ncbi:hypothetical protein ZIOFF_041109 [Zingiber officinale]|uniref:Uncharacterized protein n=1 Tax=Zingiber officinale TaxID=94328 RepID=A0A8J5G756_ZINOF|nr:hypothetical protein ZIOFF_041109 [Zingiber officinale]
MSSFDLNQASSIEEEEHDLCVPNHLFTALYHRSSDYSCITFDRHQQHESLCNACGIRQRKARRAMAAALHGGVGLTGGGGGHATAVVANKARKETKLGIDRTDLPFKKRCKVNITASPPRPPPKKLCFDDAALKATNKHNNSTVIKKVFPQEERDAAVLLMALSCGIIRS